jgi:AcrR family transcriptional regulator
MARDAERTRARILDAAAHEFSAYGIAGARVDRIAAAAGCNKAMIYAYFTSKDGLFDAVFTARVADVLETTPFDGHDLPGYAGRLFDYYQAEPQTLRLATWYQLERPESTRLEAIAVSNQAKLDQIAAAQRDGVVRRDLAPVEVLALVRAAAASWFAMTPELGRSAPADPARRRDVVVDAARRWVA